MTAILQAQELKKELGGRNVLDVDLLEVERGEMLVVLGKSGAGKSVLLRVLNLLEQPTSGKVVFEDAEVQGLSGGRRLEVARKMAMIFQEPMLFRGTVARNVEYGLKVRGVDGETRAAKARAALEAVNLEGLDGRDVRTLSGGEAQRVSLARAIVLEPELLLLDEPFASLDPINRKLLQQDVRSIIRSKNISAVFVTHDLDEAAVLGDRIAVLSNGRIEQQGTPVELFYSPANEQVARFVGVENVLHGRVAACSGGMLAVTVDGREIEVMGDRPCGEEVKLGLRPEDITLVPETELGHPTSARNSFAGEVVRVNASGPTARVTVACPFEVTAMTTRRSQEELGLQEGVRAGVRFKATAVMLL